MNKPEELKIPAFQRLRSIQAKSKTKKIRLSKTPKKLQKISFEEISINQDLTPNTPPKPSKRAPKTTDYKTAGSIEGYYDKIDVTILKLTSPLKIGDTILIEKSGGLFKQRINSMQIDRKEVKIARTGSVIGIKTQQAPQVGGLIYKSL